MFTSYNSAYCIFINMIVHCLSSVRISKAKMKKNKQIINLSLSTITSTAKEVNCGLILLLIIYLVQLSAWMTEHSECQ